MSRFSCKLSGRASLWDTKANQSGRQKPRSPAHQRKAGKYQDQYTGKWDQRLCDRNSYVTAEKIRNASLGMGDDCRLLQTFNEYLADFLKRVDKDRAYFTYEDYCLRRRRLAAFLEYEYHVKDIPFKEPKGDFIDKFVVYLSTVKGIASGTIHAGVKKLRLMTYTVYKNGWVSVDPFAGFHVKPTYAERRYLPCNWSSRSS